MLEINEDDMDEDLSVSSCSSESNSDSWVDQNAQD